MIQVEGIISLSIMISVNNKGISLRLLGLSVRNGKKSLYLLGPYSASIYSIVSVNNYNK